MIFVPTESLARQGVVVYSSGAELGYVEEQADLLAWSLRTGVPLLGPQSTGVVRPSSSLTALTARLRAPAVHGRVALVMQSAGLLGGTLNALLERRIGIHTAVSIGNAAVLGLDRLGQHLLQDPDVGALGIYVDTLPSIDGLVALARDADERDVPIVLAVGGSSEAGSAGVLSHTGELATPHRVIEGIADQYGVILVADTDELVWSLEAIAQVGFARPPAGGVGVFSTSGGGAIMLADAMESAGVALPLPTPAVQEELSRNRPIISYNPFDVGAAAFDKADSLLDAMSQFAGDANFGVIISVATIGLPTRTEMEPYVAATQTFVDVVRSAGKLPMIVAPVASVAGSTGPELAEWPNVPLATGIKEGAAKARALCVWGNGRGLADAEARWPEDDRRTSVAAQPVHASVISGLQAQAELEGLVARWPREITVSSVEEAQAAASELSFPVVAKAEAGLAHRLASGGLLRGVDSWTPQLPRWTTSCESSVARCRSWKRSRTTSSTRSASNETSDVDRC
jgi:acyl-CoA synthetase (NDP forming)